MAGRNSTELNFGQEEAILLDSLQVGVSLKCLVNMKKTIQILVIEKLCFSFHRNPLDLENYVSWWAYMLQNHSKLIPSFYIKL